jgi:hypothetical protein
LESYSGDKYYSYLDAIAYDKQSLLSPGLTDNVMHLQGRQYNRELSCVKKKKKNFVT